MTETSGLIGSVWTCPPEFRLQQITNNHFVVSERTYKFSKRLNTYFPLCTYRIQLVRLTWFHPLCKRSHCSRESQSSCASLNMDINCSRDSNLVTSIFIDQRIEDRGLTYQWPHLCRITLSPQNKMMSFSGMCFYKTCWSYVRMREPWISSGRIYSRMPEPFDLLWKPGPPSAADALVMNRHWCLEFVDPAH